MDDKVVMVTTAFHDYATDERKALESLQLAGRKDLYLESPIDKEERKIFIKEIVRDHPTYVLNSLENESTLDQVYQRYGKNMDLIIKRADKTGKNHELFNSVATAEKTAEGYQKT